MADTQIIIDATDTNGNPINKTIKNINPAATNAQLATFGTMLNALTDNQYGKTTKITTTDVDLESDKPVPTLQIWNSDKTAQISEISKQTANTQIFESVAIKYDGDAQLLFGVPGYNNFVKIEEERDANYFLSGLFIARANTPAGTDVVFTVFAPETDNYKAAKAQVTFHVTA